MQEVCAAGSEGAPSEVRIVNTKSIKIQEHGLYFLGCFMIKTESRMKAYLGLVEGIKQHSKLILTLKNVWGMVIYDFIRKCAIFLFWGSRI